MVFAGIVLVLNACAGDTSKNAPLLPMPDGTYDDPSNEVLDHAIASYLAQSQAPAFSRYAFQRIDLNRDGRRDALVLIKAPYNYWCNDYGCPLLVFKASKDDFSFVSQTQPVRGPLYLGRTRTNGWTDLIVHISGRPYETRDVALQFNGSSYPAHPESLPTYEMWPKHSYHKVFE